ncbi:hypothetical protein PhCBS80983_g04681 [Powellomyces hirtus]|uniref:Uncharacterized protein n=1 Tax=Powellomyces hirtus TaxID=109895 RepID=A0A507DYI4_9FUNG|nr:hypothetical protein DFJ77DRAFT_506839 [Powellomyces hirtus]TPX56205.1 hypothetical protein PhCBS80983_g04681 [Powellomyces hirtus]
MAGVADKIPTPGSYMPFPQSIAQNVATEVRSIAAGLGTDGLQEHADKISSGLHRMGDGMDSAGSSIKTGLVVVGVCMGFGLTVIGMGMILEALFEDADEGRRCRGTRRRRKRVSRADESSDT